ncbi:MAG: tetratricopeptide repeat protein, partial [Myxococcaceae bacterium]|nr:tetratricopeptide repeat protein [Myxococcaceae bacterium]
MDEHTRPYKLPADFAGAIPLPGNTPPPLPPRGGASRGTERPTPVALAPSPDVLAFGASAAPHTAPFDTGRFGTAPAPGGPLPSEDVGLDFGDEGEHAAPPAFDFADLPAPASGAPAAGEPSFTELPSPAGAPAGAYGFGDLPSPATAPPADAGFGFADLPAPAPAVGWGAGTPAAAPDPSLDFGAVDFGAPVGPGVGAAGQPGAGAELLSFIDEDAPAAGGAQRFSVRRSSGKVFGPFEEPAIVRMLEDGQLLGNEDISLDGTSWEPIGSRVAFATALQRQAHASPFQPGALEAVRGGASDAGAAALDKLRQVYEGRMAAVAVVDGGGAGGERRGWKVLVLGVAAAVLVLLVGAGASLGFTHYGVFGVRVLFPSRIAPGTAEGKALQTARAALLLDTAPDYRKARDEAARVLALEEYPELRAVWCRAVFALSRAFGDGKPAELAQAHAALEGLEVLGERELEFVKARASAALTSGRGAEARALLQGASEADQKDVELQLLLAEAYVLERNRESAIATLTRILKATPKSARAHHMLAKLHLAVGRAREEARAAAEAKLLVPGAAGAPGQLEKTREERDQAAKAAHEAFDKAAASFRAALDASADHLHSALELADLELTARGDATAAVTALEPVLAKAAEKALLPVQRARALATKGAALLKLGRPEEAEPLLRSALELDPKSLPAKTHLARIFLSRRAYADALPLYRDAHQAEPGDLDAAVGFLEVLLASGQGDEARKVVEAASSRFPGNARIAYLYGRVEDSRDGGAGAEEHFRRAVHAAPDMAEARLSLVRISLRTRRPGEARTQLEELAKRAPDSALLHLGQGELALAEGDVARAKLGFDRALALQPTLADAHLGLSRVAATQGSFAAARTAAQAALAQEPALRGARLQLGRVLARLGELEAAEKELVRAREEAPHAVEPALALGEVRLARKDVAGAEKILREAQAAEPFNAEVLMALGQTLAARLDYEEALDRLRQGVDRAPKRADYKFILGKVLRDAQKASEAVKVWKAAVQQEP